VFRELPSCAATGQMAKARRCRRGSSGRAGGSVGASSGVHGRAGGGTLAFRAPAPEHNNVRVGLSPRRAPTAVTVQDFGQIQTPGGTVSVRLAPGSGCEPVLDSLGQQVIGYVRCPLPAGGSLPRLLAYLGDGGDTLVADAQLRAEVYGGNAFDTLTANGRVYGGAGSDSIRPVNTTDPQRRYGGLGDDFISGGAGPDTISGGPGPDWIDAGRGADKITGAPARTKSGCTGRGSDRVTSSGCAITRPTSSTARPGVQRTGFCSTASTGP
jgi:RTX calcium-binding nonapeptide repeat (4 copies)